MALTFSDKQQYRMMTMPYGAWQYYDHFKLQRSFILAIPAVYAIYLNDKLVYVGQTNNMKARYSAYGIKITPDGVATPFGVFASIQLKIRYSVKVGQEAMVEKRLIYKTKPMFNKNSKTLNKLECL